MFSVEPFVITMEERIELERRARAHTSTQREARRATAIPGALRARRFISSPGRWASINIKSESGDGGFGAAAASIGWSWAPLRDPNVLTAATNATRAALLEIAPPSAVARGADTSTPERDADEILCSPTHDRVDSY